VQLSSASVKAGDPVTATVAVTNSGSVAGDEVVEAYVKTPQKGGPIHSLAGFKRVHLAPGESQNVAIEIPARSLSSVDDAGARLILAGSYKLSIGGAQPGETTSKSEVSFTINGTMALPK
jgi:beta-glucosidase